MLAELIYSLKLFMKKIKYFRIYVSIMLALLCVPCFSQSVLDNTQLRMFTHGEYSAAIDSAGEFTHEFEAEGLDLLVTSQVTDKLSFLGEIFLSTHGHIDFHRMVARYAVNDYLNISMGKLNSPIGIWNNTFYHEARVVTPTIDHPIALTEGEEGGLILLDDVGLQAGGDNISKLRLGYRLFVSNGYSSAGTELKSFTYNVSMEPVENLKFALSGQREKIPAGTITPQDVLLMEQTDFNLYNASVLYYGGTSPFEFGAEYFVLNTTTVSAGKKASNSYFVYAGYKLKKFTPYITYNSASYKPGESFFIENNYSSTSLGVRYSVSPLSVVKLEVWSFDTDEMSKWQLFELQWAIGF
jgi:hypothetical protein